MNPDQTWIGKQAVVVRQGGTPPMIGMVIAVLPPVDGYPHGWVQLRLGPGEWYFSAPEDVCVLVEGGTV